MLPRSIALLTCTTLTVACLVGHFPTSVKTLALVQEAYPDATVTAALDGMIVLVHTHKN